MPQVINTNIASLNAQRNLSNSQRLGDSALQRLSSGLRINSAKDDAAGLAISTRFEAQTRGTSVAIRNAGDGISLAQTAESALNSMVTNLQRIRELALQSANDTNTGLDRQALQQEVSQLVDEVKNIAEKTNFNGKKLLDGSFQNAVFQTGANVGDTIKVSVGKLDTTTLGSAEAAGISSNVSGTGLDASSASLALSSGDLVINGVAVGSSAGTDDTASAYLKSSSAIAKAAAINKVSDQTGVTAVVNANTVEGTNVTNIGTAASETVKINDVSITLSVSAASTLEGVKTELQGVADQINSKKDLTGVSASVVATDTGFRVDLTAEDGRNITINPATNNATTYGLAAGANGVDTTYLGNITLVSEDGSDITLSSNTGNIDSVGFEEGTYSGVNGGVVGDASNTATSASNAGPRAALVAGDLTINGVDVGATLATDDTASSTENATSAIALAAAINRVSDQTGVTAKVNATTVYSGKVTAVGASTAFSIQINGVQISGTTTNDVAANQATIIDAINAKAGQTGVRAEALGSDQYKLVADDGRNIDIVAGTPGDTGLSTDTTVGSVTLESAGQFTLGTKTGDIEKSGLRVGTYGGGEFGQKLSDIDISTVDGANKAVQAVDNALKTITSKQAELGAIQNRFQNTISNLEALSENLQAANSRIRDADFAAETAKLSKAQVLQQAGISVLAQANARPQQVLSLLQ
ncbi:flagellin [Hahella sp. SMD15-11]|uniref:Flagellin n=1 Tax=Thermohahella caldifontis TaxID=3142973 RepID=A0AB39UY92_9GAMM